MIETMPVTNDSSLDGASECKSLGLTSTESGDSSQQGSGTAGESGDAIVNDARFDEQEVLIDRLAMHSLKPEYQLHCSIIKTQRLERHIDYLIRITTPSGVKWLINRRYREFSQLHDTLCSQHGLESSVVACPPKHVFSTQRGDAFVEQRKAGLEKMLNEILAHYRVFPCPLVDFLEWSYYDIHGITCTLALRIKDRMNFVMRMEQEEGMGQLVDSACFFISVVDLAACYARKSSSMPALEKEKTGEDFAQVLDFFRSVTHVRISGNSAKLRRSNIGVNLLRFDISIMPNLQNLELEMMDLRMMTGFHVIKPTLCQIGCHESIGHVRDLLLADVLASTGGGLDFDEVTVVGFELLIKADLSNNRLTSIDSTTALMPNVQTLNLSFNKIRQITSLEHLKHLHTLNLSNNQLDEHSIEHFASLVGHQIKYLFLVGNNLRSLHILRGLDQLECLNFADNSMHEFESLSVLLTMPNLQSVILRGNPISINPYYRRNFFYALVDRYDKITLDDQAMSDKERTLVDLHKTVVSARH